MNYYDRLKAYGWELYYKGARWDYFKKTDKRGNKWTVAVPWTTLAEPIFERNGRRLSPSFTDRQEKRASDTFDEWNAGERPAHWL